MALGYQGGVKAFQKMAANYGTDVDEATALKIETIGDLLTDLL